MINASKLSFTQDSSLKSIWDDYVAGNGVDHNELLVLTLLQNTFEQKEINMNLSSIVNYLSQISTWLGNNGNSYNPSYDINEVRNTLQMIKSSLEGMRTNQEKTMYHTTDGTASLKIMPFNPDSNTSGGTTY